MGRIVSFIIVIVIVVAKYFIYKHLDTKKINEEVEQSKTIWVPEFKTEYLANCTKPIEGGDPSLNMDVYCNCVAEVLQKNAVFPTAYNADEMTADQYQTELEKLSNAYFDSAQGKEMTDACADMASQAK